MPRWPRSARTSATRAHVWTSVRPGRSTARGPTPLQVGHDLQRSGHRQHLQVVTLHRGLPEVLPPHFLTCLSNLPLRRRLEGAAEEFVKEEHRTGRPAGSSPTPACQRWADALPAAPGVQDAPRARGRRSPASSSTAPHCSPALRESGPSRIRQWLLEEDLVDAIIALPTDMFFNTGIATYVWILDNDKQPEQSAARCSLSTPAACDEDAQGMGPSAERSPSPSATRSGITRTPTRTVSTPRSPPASSGY